MQKLLLKRVIRDLKRHAARYLALGFMILLSMYLVISVVGAAQVIINGTHRLAEDNHVEDGYFELFVPLDDAQYQTLTEAGATIEECFYQDYDVDDQTQLRIFKNRKKIDLVNIDEGTSSEENNQIVLEKRFAEENGFEVGDRIIIADVTLTVSGIGSSPDYESVLQTPGDVGVDSDEFGIAFVNDETYEQLFATNQAVTSETYQYSYLLGDELTDKELKSILKDFELNADDVDDEYFREYYDRMCGTAKELKEYKDGIEEYTKGVEDAQEGADELAEGVSEFSKNKSEIEESTDGELSDLTAFVKAENNPRIYAAASDLSVNYSSGVVIGVIIIVLFTFVISVFVVHQIDSESQVIGAMYSLGVKRRELIVHYIMLPTIVTFAAGLIGTLIGYSKWGITTQMADTYAYYSVPDLEPSLSAGLLIYGVIMPPIVALIVNVLVIQKRLKRTALSLLKNEQKQGRIASIQLGDMKFLKKFCIRQILRESRSYVAVMFGMFISLLLAMMGVNCLMLCLHLCENSVTDTKYSYMYTLKYPQEEVPQNAQEAYGVSLSKECFGYHFDVTILGVNDDFSYFDVEVGEGTNQIAISDAMATKYGVDVGDELVLDDDGNDRKYAFTVTDIFEYSSGFFAVMNIDDARELFEAQEDDYNILFSDEELDIESGRIYSVATKDDVEKSALVFLNLMSGMIYVMCIVAVIIFVLVMYLMMKVMIDRSSYSIALVKIFGFRKREIRKLYLNGNFLIIAIGALICIPVSKKVMDLIYPYFVSNVAIGANYSFYWWMYPLIYVFVIGCYFLTNVLLMRRLAKVEPNEVLKNRD
ncbi:ABC transporter permease [Eubacterium oxidoreducens]|uniref:Putative ABC transport system permease protein n=1 Tax=Eubacterium oxidoreducens TaxID=1732 RepID=A0A1G6BHK8_EUBOX|nr:ABC transporter permease [Eubacterium oxidoreducens]SDB20097.1 putative ABC transport system permease protein [Eubacterium oxidoreducens]